MPEDIPLPPAVFWIVASANALVVFLLFFDRFVSAVGRLGLLPSRLRKFQVRWATNVVKEQHDKDVIALLVEIGPKLEMIVEEMSPNGGASFRDEMCKVRDGLKEFQEFAVRADQWHRDHEAFHAQGD